jgi:hypothetical protein
MGIKGLTDRGLSFPEIGQIRKGAKKDGNRPGLDLTYFRVEFDEKEVEAAEKFTAIYGSKPEEIRIVLPFNDIPRMWDAWLEAYTAGRMIARSDGEYYTYLIDTETGEMLVKNGLDIKTGLPKPYVDGKPVGFYKDGKGIKQPVFCKPTGRLKVIIPELGRAAYLTVMTTSKHDIANLSGQLEAFKTVNGGLIAGIPLILRRRPKKISCPNPDGTRARRVKYMLSIEADPQWMSKMIGHLNALALPGGNKFEMLTSGEEVEVTHEEFTEPEDDIQEGDFTQQDEQMPVEQIGSQDDGAAQFWAEEMAWAETGKAPAVPEPVQQPIANGKPERPLSPASLRAYLDKKADAYASVGKTANAKQRSLLVMLLNQIFQDDSKRHEFQFGLLGMTSSKAIDDQMVLALLDWLKPQNDSGGEYRPDPMAIREAQAVLTAAQQKAGQAELI